LRKERVQVRNRKRDGKKDSSDDSSNREPTGGRDDLSGPSPRRWPSLSAFLASTPHYLLPIVATFALTLPLYAPWSIWPVAYIAFVPWLLLVCLAPSAIGTYLASYLLGVAFFLTHWRWLYETTPPAYLAGCLAFALYFCLGAWLVRHLRRRRCLPVTFAFALVWVSVEFMRSRGVLAFPWFLLGHTQIRLISLMQIADITGVYGISLAVAMVNGLIVDLILRRKHSGLGALRAWPAAPICVIAVFAVMFGYGWYRLATLPVNRGPKVAVLQADFLLKAEEGPDYDFWKEEHEKQRAYLTILNKVSPEHPDVIVLPETPWTMYLNKEFLQLDPAMLKTLNKFQQLFFRVSREWFDRFSLIAQREHATIVVGAISTEQQPAGVRPPEYKFNSAFVFRPDGSEMGRYDKNHLVLFGEYVPFRYSIPPLYRWLNGVTPWGQGGYEYSLTPGNRPTVFEARGQTDPNQAHHFGVTICYEDVIPQVFRRFILAGNGEKRVDFMLNISNDGWFGHGAQQPQHLVNCAFRAIENRVGVARAANTGISGFIRPDGTWHDLVHTDPNWPLAGGTGCQAAHIDTSPVVTFYSRFGDVFGFIISAMGFFVAIDAIVSRRREKRLARRSLQPDA
jgi:apolipoprotein N-acyltransferase